MSGRTILSCGHEDEHKCCGVSVQFEDEDCVAGEGFVPVTVHAQYCHECATKLYYELGKDAGRVETEMAIVAWLRSKGLTGTVTRIDQYLANAIEAGEHHDRG
jgi:hypothetical protein